MTAALFETAKQLGGTEHWRRARDGDPTGLALYLRHYSARRYADARARRLFVGPGEKLVLVAHDDSAVFAWQRQRERLDGQTGINCAVFRNEGAVLSSDLIREADAIADERWPEERHFTFVAPSKVRSTNPGFCFLQAGWRRAGRTRGGHGRPSLVVLERAA